MRDNQNADLAMAKKRIGREKADHDAGMAKLEKELADAKFAEWTQVDDVMVLRVENSAFVAAPTSGCKSSRLFDIIDLDKGVFVCQVGRREVKSWLKRMG